MFRKVLIANRGVAAVRLARTLRRMGIASVGLRSAAEAEAACFDDMDEVFDLGEGGVAETYLNASKIIAIAEACGAEAIHPGYGFLSESAAFAAAVEAAGIRFIGPGVQAIEAFGLKHRAREAARAVGVNMLPGSPLLADVSDAVSSARTLGYPVILKSTAGGGGIGMQRCDSESQLLAAFDSVSALASANFAAAGLYLEKCLAAPRHVEVQVFGDGKGGVLVLGDRDCSLQRRNQKVIEECPAPGIPAAVRQQLHEQARALACHVNYASAGTVEFLFDPGDQSFYFLEVNTRLQVEHGVTELVYGIDLVEWMVRLAAGELGPLSELGATLNPSGCAIQARLYAEDPYLDFRPSPGRVEIDWATDLRVDTWVSGRVQVSHLFDPMLANVISLGKDREAAIAGLSKALLDQPIHGIVTNRAYLAQALASPAFRSAEMTTQTLGTLRYTPDEFAVISPGLQTSVQSFPGRQGYWEVGVPPSGPMDDLSFRIGNTLLGNPVDAAGLEILFSGPTLQFRGETEFVVTGGSVPLLLDDHPVPMWQVVRASAGQRLVIGTIEDGLRAYLLVRCGLDVRSFLGSTTTFTLGKFGGHDGRALRTGDVLGWHRGVPAVDPVVNGCAPPDLAARTSIRVQLGPHSAPDFFTDADIEVLFSATWRVHHNTSRTGVRLIGPQPQWARQNGGEAGLHPSNIHDNAYAFGALDFTGDMPVILGPDGPSLGGFVCPAVVIRADLWKLGQLRPGDELHLSIVSEQEALEALRYQEVYIRNPAGPALPAVRSVRRPVVTESPVLWRTDSPLQVVMRRAGHEWILVEFGPMALDIRTRVVVHRFRQLLDAQRLRGLVEMTPGIRSLQIRYDCSAWRTADLVRQLEKCIAASVDVADFEVPSRIVHLPLSWEDPACQEAVDRYVTSVRADAPWCPDNVEFIRRINGLDSKQQVRDIVFGARYLVMGLGDVFLGAPVATPLDPRHRLVTTKYNPARTWTAENSVGIGGSYLCVYGMEGPGGYQFVGRTTPVWRESGFADRGTCWLLDHFDQLQFHEVDAAALLEMREAARRGSYLPRIESTRFSLREYQAFIAGNSEGITQFTRARERAFDAELARWRDAGLHVFAAEEASHAGRPDDTTEGLVIESPIAGSVWKIHHPACGSVAAEEEIVTLEAMKSEFCVKAPAAGMIRFLVKEGQVVDAGQPVAVIQAVR